MRKGSLRSRIFLPFLALMVLMPIGAYWVFGTVSERHATNLAQDELSETITSVRALVESIYVAPGDQQNPSTLNEQAQRFLSQTRTALKKGQFASALIVLSRRYEVVYPSEPDDETMAIAAWFDPEMAVDATQGVPRFESLNVAGQDYIACLLRLTDPEQMLSNYLIVYSSVDDMGELIRTSAMFVLLITAVLALVALIISWMIATSISEPIRRLCGHVSSIGAGDFRQTDQFSSVNEVNELIEATNATAARLARYDEAQRLFFQNASHELRTPLMSIQGYAEGIGLGVWDDCASAAGVIADESKRLTRLVDELLTLSRIDNDQQTIDIEPIELGTFLKNTLEHLSGMALREGVTLRFEDESGNALIAADEQLLTKVVSNVLSNAIRYAQSHVSLRLIRREDRARLVVSDDGPGIPPEALEKVFDRFFKGEGGQFGIGLSLARSGMGYMGGTIRALPCEHGALFELLFVLNNH